MLLVQPATHKQKQYLEEWFQNQGNYYLVPNHSTNCIQSLINLGLLETLADWDIRPDDNHSSPNMKSMEIRKEGMQTIKLICILVSSLMKNKLCLGTLRSVFEQVRKKQDTIRQFNFYMGSIEQIVRDDFDMVQNLVTAYKNQTDHKKQQLTKTLLPDSNLLFDLDAQDFGNSLSLAKMTANKREITTLSEQSSWDQRMYADSEENDNYGTRHSLQDQLVFNKNIKYLNDMFDGQLASESQIGGMRDDENSNQSYFIRKLRNQELQNRENGSQKQKTFQLSEQFDLEESIDKLSVATQNNRKQKVSNILKAKLCPKSSKPKSNSITDDSSHQKLLLASSQEVFIHTKQSDTENIMFQTNQQQEMNLSSIRYDRPIQKQMLEKPPDQYREKQLNICESSSSSQDGEDLMFNLLLFLY